MNKEINKLYLIAIVFSALFSFSSNSWAKLNDLPGLEIKKEISLNDLIEEANQYYAEKNITQSILYLSKAILKNPETARAFSIIEKISLDKTLSPKQQKGLLQVEDMLNFIHNLKQKISYFQEKKDMLYADLIEKGFQGDALSEELISVETKVWQENLPADFLWNEKDLEIQGPLNVAIRILEAKQRELSAQLEILTKQHASLRERNKSSQQIISNKQDVRELIAQKKNDLYKQQLALIREKADYFEQKTRSAEDRMEQLTQQIIDTALKLSEKDQEFNKQAQQLASLSEHIEELESRFQLREHILAEKDSSFEALKGSLKEIKQTALLQKEEINKILYSKDKNLEELTGILQIYKEKLGEASREIKEKTRDVAALENQLAYIQNQLSEKEIIIKKAHEQIKEMKQQLKEVQDKFSCQGT